MTMKIWDTGLNRGLFIAVCVMAVLAVTVGALAVWDQEHPDTLVWLSMARSQVASLVSR